MAQGTMTVNETVIIEYEIHYDEDEYEKYDGTLEDHISEYDNNAWKAMSEGNIITDIQHNQIIDYVDSDDETLELELLKWEKY
jgi:alkyl hydroperoxide reductase subunit AhpF